MHRRQLQQKLLKDRKVLQWLTTLYTLCLYAVRQIQNVHIINIITINSYAARFTKYIRKTMHYDSL